MEADLTTGTGQIIPHPYAYGAHAPGRCQFSVLCWRGWCDNNYRDREIGAMVKLVAGGPAVPAAGLSAQQCPTPDRCDCECHDKREEVSAMTGIDWD
jgi:hypothetical protein